MGHRVYARVQIRLQSSAKTIVIAGYKTHEISTLRAVLRQRKLLGEHYGRERHADLEAPDRIFRWGELISACELRQCDLDITKTRQNVLSRLLR